MFIEDFYQVTHRGDGAVFLARQTEGSPGALYYVALDGETSEPMILAEPPNENGSIRNWVLCSDDRTLVFQMTTGEAFVNDIYRVLIDENGASTPVRLTTPFGEAERFISMKVVR